MNDSSTGGYLLPTSADPGFDITEDAALQAMVAGITGLTPNLLFPRWQPVMPKQPTDTQTDWAALGVQDVEVEKNVSIRHLPTPDPGYDEMRAQQTFTLLVSFYGPNSSKNAHLLANGIYLPQNREAIWATAINLVEVGRIVRTGDLVNQNWRLRVDVPIVFRRMITRTYAIDNLLEAVGSIENDSGHVEPFDTNNVRN